MGVNIFDGGRTRRKWEEGHLQKLKLLSFEKVREDAMEWP